MSIFTKLWTELGGSSTGAKIESFIVTLGKTELKIVESDPLGAAVVTAIKAGEAGTTSVEKMELALASFLPTLASTIANPSAAETDLKTLGTLILESGLAVLKPVATGPLTLIKTLIKAL